MADGTEAKPETKLQAEPTEGWGGRSIGREHDLDALTPANIKSLLVEAEGGDICAQAELFELMEERDEELDGHLRTRKAGVAQAEWTIEPADESSEAEQVAQFCRDVVADIEEEHGGNIADFIFDLLDAIPKGFAVQEIKWRMGRDAWVPEGFIYRPQRWFTLADDGLTLMLCGEGVGDALAINPLNFVIHRVKARSGFAWRAGLLRSCIRCFIVRHYSWKDWLSFAEVYGMPPRVGELPENVAWDSVEAKALWSMLVNMGTDMAAMLPAGAKLEFMQTPRGEGEIYQKIIEAGSRGLALAVLGQLLTSGGETGGSYALGKVHNQVRWDLIETDAFSLEGTLTSQLLRPIVRLNKGEKAPVPRWNIVLAEPEDLQATATTVKTLGEAGLRIPARWVYEKFGIPEPEEGEEVLERPAPTGVMANAPGLQRPIKPRSSVLQGAQFVACARHAGLAPDVLQLALNQAPSGRAYGVLPEEALEFLGEKRVADAAAWDALSPAGKQRAWWVTGLDQQQTASVADILQGVVRAGASEAQFLERLEAAGLSVPGGEEPGAGQIPAWQARLVDRNNRRAAYDAANYQQMQRDRDVRPYGQWISGDPCEICAPYSGHVAPLDSFRSLAPPLHHQCQCELVSVSAAEVEREGLAIAEELPPSDMVPEEWRFGGANAYYLEGRGQGPSTEAGQRDAELLAGLPLPEQILGG